MTKVITRGISFQPAVFDLIEQKRGQRLRSKYVNGILEEHFKLLDEMNILRKRVKNMNTVTGHRFVLIPAAYDDFGELKYVLNDATYHTSNEDLDFSFSLRLDDMWFHILTVKAIYQDEIIHECDFCYDDFLKAKSKSKSEFISQIEHNSDMNIKSKEITKCLDDAVLKFQRDEEIHYHELRKEI